MCIIAYNKLSKILATFIAQKVFNSNHPFLPEMSANSSKKGDKSRKSIASEILLLRRSITPSDKKERQKGWASVRVTFFSFSQ